MSVSVNRLLRTFAFSTINDIEYGQSRKSPFGNLIARCTFNLTEQTSRREISQDIYHKQKQEKIVMIAKINLSFLFSINIHIDYYIEYFGLVK